MSEDYKIMMEIVWFVAGFLVTVWLINWIEERIHLWKKAKLKKNQAKLNKKKEQDECDHVWIEMTPFVLDGYTKYRCQKCNKEKTEGYTLNGE